MRDRIEDIRARGAELVIVGNGAQNFAAAFREDFELDCPILVDPELCAYRAAGLRRGRVELAVEEAPMVGTEIADLEQQVHEDAEAGRGRHTTGGGVGLETTISRYWRFSRSDGLQEELENAAAEISISRQTDPKLKQLWNRILFVISGLKILDSQSLC